MKTPKLRQDKRSGKYYVEVPTAGGPRRVTTRCTDKADAKRVVSQSNVKELIIQANAGRLTNEAMSKIVGRGRKVTLALAVQEWSDWARSIGHSEFSIKNMGGQMREWLRVAKTSHLPPSMVAEKQISAWVNDPKEALKATSRNMKLASVRSLFRFCAAKGYCIGDPSQLVRVNYSLLSHRQKEVRPRAVFTDQEIAILLSECHRRAADGDLSALFWKAAIAIGRWTGLRLGDICQLEWDCLEVPGQISTWTDKRDRRVSLPLVPVELAAAIEAVPRQWPKYLFPYQRELARSPTRRALLSTQFGRLCHAVGVKGRVFHDLRSSYATACLRDGVPMPHISQSLGHRAEITTKIYIHE